MAHRVLGGYAIRTAGRRLGRVPGWSHMVFPTYNGCLRGIEAVAQGVLSYNLWVEQGGGVKGTRC